MFSATAVSRITMPLRTSNCWAILALHSVGLTGIAMRCATSDQRPSAAWLPPVRARKRRRNSGEPGGPSRNSRRPRSASFGVEQIAQGMQRVVGDHARPHQFPERGLRVAGEAAARGLMERREERCAHFAQHAGDALRVLGKLGRRCWRRAGAAALGQIERDAAIAIAELLEADPHHFAGGHQRVEIGGAVIEHARRQDLALQIGGGQRRALQNLDGVEQGVEAAAWDSDAVPAGEQAAEGVLFGGFDLAAQAGERLAADLLQHLGVAPFAMHALGTELAFEQLAIGVQAAQDGLDLRGRQAET